MQTLWTQGQISVAVGDITRFEGDAIVNAANRTLLGGGGVDGAIHRAAGRDLLAACRHLRESEWPDGLPVGEVALTAGFALPARHVIHTVGPVYAKSEDRADQLASCYRKSLELAGGHGFERIAFPAISTGVYGYPPADAAQVVWQTLTETLPAWPKLEVTLVFFSRTDADTFLGEVRPLPE
ncbi:O-acetyl-ADP-ribose deacetylase [Salinicola rhizosphaerae]|uniref:O-acetyl-ADP-ribose deacetylase n=1 Tax=Salinicola rhizosphaerae TaxID=1443141 RepID=A0ABQ3E1I3_9GAMM|nr:O-acetyl-ADP-ribose deacetylase [Salinicola rhizosphaerae]GHB19480.1 O-acetyl-ADP-ribose deacetylase [Salinicola rhizosphaerae]